MIKAYN